ncbi:MAG TPA: GNAT family protein [Pseudolabrys sp.]|nr:GNAT family protein [Pseudolabrys sp.]
MNSEPDPKTGQPVGLPVDTTPAKRPGPVVLQGRFGLLEKLNVRHAAALWPRVKDHDEVWTYMSRYGPFAGFDEFSKWMVGFSKSDDPYTYAVVDTAGRAVGFLALMRIEPAMRVIEVGHVLYSPSLQRTPLATEAQYLLARYVFETLGYRRYEWKCHWLNDASRRAAVRLGFTFEGIHRQLIIAKGRNRDTAWYSMLDGEWPKRKSNYERWLAPDNFTADGRQKLSLSALNSGNAAQ